MVEIFDNIRKLYQFRDPCEELREYIEFFSETSLEATHRYIQSENFTVKLFPSYTPTIWINLGSPYQLQCGCNLHFIGAGEDVLLLRNSIVERRNLPTDNIFTVKFYPGGFEAIFGIEQARIGSEIIHLDHILSRNLIGKMKKLDGFESRMAYLQQHFLDLMNRRFSEDYLYQKVIAAVKGFEASGMCMNNQTLAEYLAITEKTFYRYFKSLVGAPPKEYFSILRARKALMAYVSDKKSFSPYDFGYYDRSHFSREVFRFTGQRLSAP